MLDRRGVLRTLAGLFLSGFGLGGAYAWEPRRQNVTRYRLRPNGWPEGKRLRIAVLSDIHAGGAHMPISRIGAIVDHTNLLKPDLVLLLGDFVASRDWRPGDPQPAEWAAELALLQAPNGVFGVLGNHDWWHDEHAQRQRRGPTLVGAALEAVGIRVLENEALKLDTAAGSVWLAGLGDQWAFPRWSQGPGARGRHRGIDDLAGTLAKVTDDAPLLLMAHEPDIFARTPARIALTVSGHTHGGQIRLFGWSPIVPSRYGNRYAYGHIVENGRNLIVSAGLGVSDKAPVRFGVPPEIVLIELG